MAGVDPSLQPAGTRYGSRLRILTVFLISLVFVLQLSAQSDSVCPGDGLCCEHVTLPAGVMVGPVSAKKTWMVGYRYMHSGLGSLSGSAAGYEMWPDKMKMDMHMLMGMYGISDRFTAMVMLNFQDMSMQMKMPDGKAKPGEQPNMMTHTMKSAGLGDIQVHGIYALLNDWENQLTINAGLNLPTGSISQSGPANSMVYPSKRYPYNMQLGSGTADLMPGLSYFRNQKYWQHGAQLASVFRVYHNANGYRLGDELKLNIWTVYKLCRPINLTMRAQMLALGPIHGQDSELDPHAEPAANTGNYGGKVISAAGGFCIGPSSACLKQFRLSFEYEVPLVQKLNGVQMKNVSTLFVALSKSF